MDRKVLIGDLVGGMIRHQQGQLDDVNDRVADPARYVKSVVRGDAWFASGQVVGTGSLAFAGSNTVAASYKAADLNVDDLRAVRKAGIGMFVWTINDEATMRGLIEAGVTGIVTDFPQRLASLSR